MVTEGSLPLPQEPITGSYPEQSIRLSESNLYNFRNMLFSS
jgi:hypothetical protein